MPGPTSIPRGNVVLHEALTITISPSAVAANTTAEQTFTVVGLAVGDFVEVNKPSAQAGLGIVNSRVSAPNTLAITFSNNTGSSIQPTANEQYLLEVVRVDNLNAAGTGPLLTQIT